MLKIFRGLPGSGKTTKCIELKETLTGAVLFLADVPRHLRTQIAEKKIFARSGKWAAIDMVLSREALIATLSKLPCVPVVIDEFQYFSGCEDAVLKYAERADIFLSTPTPLQLEALTNGGGKVEELRSRCELFNDGDATAYFIHNHTSMSVCRDCADMVVAKAKDLLEKRLLEAQPYPGERHLYQPVELPEYADWKCIREDSAQRLFLMKSSLMDYYGEELTGRSYLDIGCNIGYFVRKLSSFGLVGTGVDVAGDEIWIARHLANYFYLTGAQFFQRDAAQYLEELDGSFDVTSSFSTFQWLMVQGDVGGAVNAMKRMFDKTNGVCFLELGYSSEAHYAKQLSVPIDQNWVRQRMEEEGRFRKIVLYEAADHRLKRDLFVGIK